VYQLRVHKVEELLDIWYGLQQSTVDSAVGGERAFVYQVMDLCINMLIQRSMIRSTLGWPVRR